VPRFILLNISPELCPANMSQWMYFFLITRSRSWLRLQTAFSHCQWTSWFLVASLSPCLGWALWGKDDTISVFISQGQVQYQLLTELEGCLSWLLTGINMYLLNLNRVKGSVLVSGDTKVHLSDYSNNFEFLEGRDWGSVYSSSTQHSAWHMEVWKRLLLLLPLLLLS
jgi:hypothetical protein